MSFAKIKEHVNQSVCAIKETVDDYLAYGGIRKRTRTPTIKAFTERDRRYVFLSSKRNRHRIVPESTHKFNVGCQFPVYFSTIRRSLQKFSMNGRVACTCLQHANIRKRLKFAKKHVKWTKAQWDRVLFSDKCKIQLFGNHRRVMIRRMRGERYLSRCLVPTVNHGLRRHKHSRCTSAPQN